MNVLLESAASVVASVLTRRGFAVAGPVTASFQTAPNGSSGVGVWVKLKDPSQAAAAEAALHEDLGAQSDVDDVRIC